MSIQNPLRARREKLVARQDGGGTLGLVPLRLADTAFQGSEGERHIVIRQSEKSAAQKRKGANLRSGARTARARYENGRPGRQNVG